MVNNVNSSLSLFNYLGTQQGFVGSALYGGTTGTAGDATSADPVGNTSISRDVLQRAVGMSRSTTAVQNLEKSQKTLAADLRGALDKAGVKLTGAIQFSVTSDGGVEIKGSDADKAAIKKFLSADTSNPSFASRIAVQAQDALKLSSVIQQSAAISQAATVARTSSGVISLYASLMQQAASTRVVFSLSADASSLVYPGSLTQSA